MKLVNRLSFVGLMVETVSVFPLRRLSVASQ